MNRRAEGMIIGLVVGLCVAAIASSWQGTGHAWGDDGRMSEEQATREFLDVRAGEIHLRPVPKPRLSGDYAWSGNPGTVGGYADAVFEFFREDTMRWFVDLVEVAVGERGTLTVEVVDRPDSNGKPKMTLARLSLAAEPGRLVLVGVGIEGIGERAVAAAGAWVLMPEYARNETKVGRQRDSVLTKIRVRILGTGGRALDSTAPVASRDFTTAITPSAWGPVSTMDQSLSLTDEELEGLSFSYVPAVVRWRNGPFVRPARRHTALGVMYWSPTRDSSSYRASLGADESESVLGPLTVTKVGEKISLALDGRTIDVAASPHPLWVTRILFTPASK